MQALLKLFAIRPSLLAEHAAAYSDLLAAEWPLAVSTFRRSVVLNLLALLCLWSTLLLTGMALMLWGMLAEPAGQAVWLLGLVPLLALAGAGACLVAARMRADTDAFEETRRQFRADLTMLREADSTS